MIKVAVPNKGLLSEPAIDLLKACGYKVNKAAKVLSSLDSENGVEFYFLRPRDIPMYVGRGIIDAGITGVDFCEEVSSPAEKVLDLPFGASRLCAAVPEMRVCESLRDLQDLRIATSFPGIVRRFFNRPEMMLVELEGAVEISVALGIADAVVDVVETGTTLRQAGMRILGEPLFRSNAALFRHPGRGSKFLDTMEWRLRGKILAMEHRMIEYDVHASLLNEACAITPGLEAPTVTPLHNSEWFSVKALARIGEANAAMDRLLALGCKGILLFNIESARI